MEANDLAKTASTDEMMSDQVKIQYIQVLTFQKYIKWMEYPTGPLQLCLIIMTDSSRRIRKK